ncbi:TVP38/TMEM64 family protein [Loigolactobacillus bifermentans]|jgi:uncharacterized membrane protein YdjX (TVP38/TMEM64 family)|uniref:TVP38/TMEM64 family membrane protein n=1 Tax=Loigolactobacillus bifermentans DSM 20003 TaxID=1423726 RepID=A0A0R1GG81_9LACO|nr:TVP38/TMEM64 family protein [Loigolactobacillus bifermentans]KRK33196.1 hypothetical protein FC07_GL001451 [Loigolactobacillus bifermentans DSM 20003]QGG60544.1 TVP38/TMEM64 family protein [Loigolactobacillus bifermentans]
MVVSTKKHQWLQLIALLTVIGAGILSYHLGLLSSVAQLQAFIRQAGLLGPMLFILLQVVQVIFPIIPGGLTTIAAVTIFGAKLGFLYNYVGISLGSVAAFLLVRHFGPRFLRGFVPEKTFNKYQHYLNGGKKFDRFFALAILLPVAPDDILCMLAGLTKMSLKKFSAIIILCKPWTILAYSLGMSTLLQVTLQHL